MSQLELVQAGTLEEKNNTIHSPVSAEFAADLLSTSVQKIKL